MLARRIAAVVLAALVAAPVAAQSSGPRPSGGDPTTALLESVPLVFGASRFDQLATEAPASVTVISADDIAGRGWRTLGDALQMVRGFYVTDDGLYPTVGARAFGRPGDYNSRLLLIIDGHRINDYLYDAFGPGFEGILDIADIDRIEIIRGPSSSLYGNSAFFGVINVFTVRGRSLGGVRARVAAESFGTREATLSVGGRTTRGLDVYVSGTVRRSDGRDFFFADFDTSAAGGWARGLDGTARDRATARLAWNGLTITAMANQRRKDYATARYLVDYGVPGNSVRDRQMFIGATYERSLAQGATARAQFSLNHTGYEGRYIYGGERNADFLDAYWLVGEGQLTRPLGTRHRAVFGAQSTVPLKAAQGTRDAVDGAFFNDVRQVLGAVYAQDEVRVGTNWILSGGVRVDYAGTFGVNVSPRLGVIRDLGAGSALKLLYGTAFRAPNNFERFYNAFDFTPNPNVRPERVHTTELLLEQRVHTRAKLSASVFHSQVDDLIDYAPADVPGKNWSDNIGTARAVGAEVEGEWEWRQLRAHGTYALQRGRDATRGVELENAPRHVAQADLVVRPLAKSRITLEWRAMSSRATRGGATVPGVQLVNGWVAQELPFPGQPRVVAGAFNLFARQVLDPVGEDFVQRAIPQAGRQFRLSLSFGR